MRKKTEKVGMGGRAVENHSEKKLSTAKKNFSQRKKKILHSEKEENP